LLDCHDQALIGYNRRFSCRTGAPNVKLGESLLILQ